jgi:hypothetical protein
MEWFYPLWEISVFRRPSEPSVDPDRAGSARVSGAGRREDGQPTPLDLWLIECVYEVMAAETTCRRCGAVLSLHLQLLSPLVDRPVSPWRVFVVTRCAGWRHHRHVASVVKGSRSLHFGPLCPSSRRAARLLGE